MFRYWKRTPYAGDPGNAVRQKKAGGSTISLVPHELAFVTAALAQLVHGLLLFQPLKIRTILPVKKCQIKVLASFRLETGQYHAHLSSGSGIAGHLSISRSDRKAL